MSTVEVTTPVLIKNILFATDFAKSSEHALGYAANIARHYSSTLHIVHAYDPVGDSKTDAQQHANELDRCELLAGITHWVHLDAGNVLEALRNRVKHQHIDLIVVGTHGRGGVSKLIQGSVAEQVLRQLEPPTLTVGPNANSPPDRIDFRCVLYPTDFSTASQHALPYALSISEEYRARLILLHAIIPSEVPWEDPSGEAIAKCNDRLSLLVPTDNPSMSRPQFIAEYGLAAETIVNVAKQRGAELIVMGVHSRGAIQASTHLPWPVAHSVICHATCPVLTVHD